MNVVWVVLVVVAFALGELIWVARAHRLARHIRTWWLGCALPVLFTAGGVALATICRLHQKLIHVLSLVEATLRLVNCRLQLILYGSDHQLLGGWLVGNFLGADSGISYLVCYSLIRSSVLRDSTFEIDDVVLDG